MMVQIVGSENYSGTTYGNLINEHSWLFDRKAAMSITINGQLLLLMLAEKLNLIGCKIISANTDGLTIQMLKGTLIKHQEVCNQWCKETRMNLEHVEYEKIIRYAVNDYIAVKKGFSEANIDEKKDYIKEKGLFITKTRLGKGLTPLIIPKALKSYFLYNESIDNFVKNHYQIEDFLMCEKTGKQWHVEHNGVPQQRTNRFIATNNGPYLMKWKTVINDKGKDVKQYSNMLVDSGVIIMNQLDGFSYNNKKSIESVNINYPYYLSKIRKLIEEIQPRQLTLF